jgi:hypothetical protein
MNINWAIPQIEKLVQRQIRVELAVWKVNLEMSQERKALVS